MVEVSTLVLMLTGYKLNGTENWVWKSQGNLMVVIWSLAPSFWMDIYPFFQMKQKCFCAIIEAPIFFLKQIIIKEIMYTMVKLIGLFQQ